MTQKPKGAQGKVGKIVKLSGTVAGTATAAVLFANGQILPAVSATAATATYFLWGRFSKGFMEAVGDRVEATGKGFGEWLFDELPVLARARWQLSSFEGRYRQNLQIIYRNLQTQGLQAGPFKVLNLEKVFVPLKLAINNPHRVDSNPVPDECVSKTLEIWNVLRQAQKESARSKISVVAPPGFGKTTLLQHVTLTLAAGKHRKHGVPSWIPILIFLRDVNKRIAAEDPPSLPEIIVDRVQNLVGVEERKLSLSASWFARRLYEGKCLVMLDGLDEVADDGERQQVSAWVGKQMRTFGRSVFIVSSRPQGYKGAEVMEVGCDLEVKPFNTEQMQRFIHHWYLQAEIAAEGRSDFYVKSKAKQQARELIDEILQNRAIAAMARNPLLVTTIAAVHYDRYALPERRVELYRQICTMMLGARRRRKGLKMDLPPEQNQQILQVLALRLMQRNTRAFQQEAGEALIGDILMKIAGDSLSPAKFLKSIRDASGLLVERQVGEYEFAHLSFQEFLAAAQIKEMQQEEILLANFSDSWWTETIRFYAAQADATQLTQKALEQRSIAGYCLAYDCALEGTIGDPQLRQHLQEVLEAGLESLDPEAATLAAQVRLRRRADNLFPLEDDEGIDLEYISNAEFQLYRVATEQKERFAPGMAKGVAIIPWWEAFNFCAWLNRKPPIRIASGYAFRLLTAAEEREYPTREADRLKAWLWDGNLTEPRRGIRIVYAKLPEVPDKHRRLQHYLVTGDWWQADKETENRMLEAMGKSDWCEVNVAGIQNCPREDLLQIDRLWATYSGDHFGFKVQKKIWLECGSTISQKTEDRLGDRTGWRKNGKWALEDVTYNLMEQTPRGHLPAKFLLKRSHSSLRRTSGGVFLASYPLCVFSFLFSRRDL